MNIEELIERGETQSLEFKESLRLKDEIGETVSAFSNSDGGTVIVGVSNNGGVLGVDIGANTLEEFANYIKRNTDPQIFPSVKIREVDGKNVVMVEVEESQERHVFFKSHAYKRVGKTNQRISSSEMRRLAKESGGRVYWDERVCEDASLEDIEEDKVRWYLERREEIRKVKKPEKMDIDTLLLNIGAAKKVNSETKPTNFEPADTRVAIFDDRIEIISPGTFPEGVTPEEPKHVPVNPILCQLMYDVGFIEKYGSGIYMINELCKEWGIQKPEYELSEVETKVIFKSGGKAIVISEIEKLGVEMNERQKEGLKIIFEKGKITNADYAEMFGVSRNTATNDLSDLVEKGLVKRVGRGRGSYYVPNI